MEVLYKKFYGCLILRPRDIPWPHAPLAWQNVFFWGHLKSKIYQRKPRILDELKDQITWVVREVPAQMLIDAIGSFHERLDSCIVAQDII